MVVIGYHAFGGDGSTAIGSRVKTLGPASTAVGIRSTVEAMTYYASLYGIDNKISTESDTGFGVSIATGAFGMLNKVDSSFNSMVFGTGNRVTNAFGNINEGIEGGFLSGRMGELLYHGGDNIGYKEHFSESWVIMLLLTAALYLLWGTATYRIMPDARPSLARGTF